MKDPNFFQYSASSDEGFYVDYVPEDEYFRVFVALGGTSGFSKVEFAQLLEKLKDWHDKL